MKTYYQRRKENVNSGSISGKDNIHHRQLTRISIIYFFNNLSCILSNPPFDIISTRSPGFAIFWI